MLPLLTVVPLKFLTAQLYDTVPSLPFADHPIVAVVVPVAVAVKDAGM